MFNTCCVKVHAVYCVGREHLGLGLGQGED